MSVEEENRENHLPDEYSSSAEMLPQVYAELRRIAQHRLNSEGEMLSIRATELVHEAYLRLSKNESDPKWANKGHFFASAAEAIRRILIDRARARNTKKRGGNAKKIELTDQIEAPASDERLLAVNDALDSFEVVDREAAEVVKLRFFGGLTVEEIANAKEIPTHEVRKHWSFAVASLKSLLKGFG